MRVRSKMEEQPSSLNEASTNGTIGTVLLNNQHMNQSKNNVPSINQKPIQIAPVPFLIGMISFSLWLVSLFRELSLFAVYPPPCHSARSRGRSRRIHHPSNYPRPPGEGGLLQTVGECRGRALSPKLLIALTGNSPQG